MDFCFGTSFHSAPSDSVPAGPFKTRLGARTRRGSVSTFVSAGIRPTKRSRASRKANALACAYERDRIPVVGMACRKCRRRRRSSARHRGVTVATLPDSLRQEFRRIKIYIAARTVASRNVAPAETPANIKIPALVGVDDDDDGASTNDPSARSEMTLRGEAALAISRLPLHRFVSLELRSAIASEEFTSCSVNTKFFIVPPRKSYYYDTNDIDIRSFYLFFLFSLRWSLYQYLTVNITNKYSYALLLEQHIHRDSVEKISAMI